MLPTPHKLTIDPAYRPFLALTESVLLTTEEVAKHWRYSTSYLHGTRRNKTGPAFVRLPGGAIRYRHAEVLAWELSGQGGPLTFDRVAMALATVPGLSWQAREKIESHLRAILCERDLSGREK